MPRSSNMDRAVKQFSRATGLQYRNCTNWEKEGKISPFQPVPDASSPSQKSFEAFVVHVIAEALRDKQIDSAILGIKKVEPRPEGPIFHLHPEMADTIVSELLPVFDSDYGGVRGVPGLRPRRYHNGRLALADASSGSTVFLQRNHKNGRDETWRPSILYGAPGTKQIWLDQNQLTLSERHELHYWRSDLEPSASHLRDLLLSRVLRRPKIVDRAGASHGWANTFTHSYFDLVIESCCGDDPRDISSDFIESGLLSGIEEIDEKNIASSIHSVNMGFGSANICVRRLSPGPCRITPERIKGPFEEIRKGRDIR
ncbi:hypothetical protein [Nocardiopsis kunsanensis]|uniref:hypothetical protein n=1 Tax=Nocardiopsis kunsanensis TaxID=141693 RepID=UPI00187391B4|nr:hypothetical protein [Nocardiopsis kunsanensis]